MFGLCFADQQKLLTLVGEIFQGNIARHALTLGIVAWDGTMDTSYPIGALISESLGSTPWVLWEIITVTIILW